MRTKLLKETTLYVNDLEVAESFYTNIIGLVVAQRVEDQYSRLHYDNSTLTLFQTQTTPIENEDPTSGPNIVGQVSFGISPPDISPWRNRLQKHDVSIEDEVSWPNGAQSINFRDPAGNRVQLKTQMRPVQDRAKEEQMRKISAGGFNTKWKLYHSAMLGGQRDSTLDE